MLWFNVMILCHDLWLEGYCAYFYILFSFSWYYAMISFSWYSLRDLPMIFCLWISLRDFAHDSLYIAGLSPWFIVYCGTLPMILCLLRDLAHDSMFIAGLCPWFFLELQDSTIIYLMYSTSYVAKSAILQCVIQITCGSGI